MPAKRHHYVPETYLREFSDADGCITVFRKNSPATPFRATPKNIGVEQYYYAFTKEDETRDTDSLEKIFSQFETDWPRVVCDLSRGIQSEDLTEELLSFACLQRARVPALRDAYELMRADALGETARLLQRMGKLPAAPPGAEDILDRVEISVDPEISIQAVGIAMKAIVDSVYPRLGFRVVHNESRLDLITSDNPVSWFTPLKDESKTKPYEMRPDAPLELIFPITPRLILVGKSTWRDEYLRRGLIHAGVRDNEAIKRANRMTAKFGYRAIFSKDRSPAALAEKYAQLSPVAQVTSFPHKDGSGQLVMAHMEFAPRRAKARWRDEEGGRVK